MSPSMPFGTCHLFDILFIFGFSTEYIVFSHTRIHTIDSVCPWKSGSFGWLNCWLAGWLHRLRTYVCVCLYIFIFRQTNLTICHFHMVFDTHSVNSAIYRNHWYTNDFTCAQSNNFTFYIHICPYTNTCVCVSVCMNEML